MDEPNGNVWAQAGCERWSEWLAGYPAVIEAQSSEKLASLDKWYREQLPGTIASRSKPCIYLDELQGVAAWKMTRGVWRERNRHLIAQNTPEAVISASREAFAAVPDPAKPVRLLSALSGVGPATASAVMSAFAPDVYPFFDELAAMFIPGLGTVAFTMKYYLAYSEALREKAAALTASCGRTWTPHDVGMALWAASGGKAKA